MWYVAVRVRSLSCSYLGSRQRVVPQPMPMIWVVSHHHSMEFAVFNGDVVRHCTACDGRQRCHMWRDPREDLPPAWYCDGCGEQWYFQFFNCRHCGEMLQCHQWDDLHHWYCDGCWDWWAAFQRMWELYSVLMLRQRSHSDIQAICASPVGFLIGSFIGEHLGDLD